VKQILLITDGCSNVGLSPVMAAAHAKAEGIVVNVIGITDGQELGEQGAAEIQEIARAGGGMSRIVSSRQLSQTVQMMTRKTVVTTIQQAVSKELKSILGDSKLEALPPESRGRVVHVIDELTETSRIKVALLIDTSASMKPKLHAVREAIYDLQLSLQARSGESLISVFHFPANLAGDQEVEMDLDWTGDLANLNRLFYKLSMKGTTPTGPAILKVVHFMADRADEIHRTSRTAAEKPAAGKEGMLSDYVV
jgi:Ca-activated chloride channel homolog